MNWDQLQAIIWLRWRLTKNRFGRAGALNAVLSGLILGLVLLAGTLSGVAGLVIGLSPLSRQPPQVWLLIWDGLIFLFLIFWGSGLMAEIQRSESVDISRLLHLPVSLQQVFTLNYAASNFTPSIIILLPGMITISLGLMLREGPGMVLLVPLVLSFIFMITAWTYCLRGWLAAIMINKRRGRTVLVWLTLGFIGLSQLPNVLIQWHVLHKKNTPAAATTRPENSSGNVGTAQPTWQLPDAMLKAHLAIPLGWVGYGAMALKEHRPWPAFGASMCGALIGILGLMRAYHGTIRFYQGADNGTKPTRTPAKTHLQPDRLIERRLPWVKDDTAALALATFRSLLRAPELKMAFVMPLVLASVFGFLRFVHSDHPPPAYLTAFAAAAAAITAAFSFLPVMSNAFGLDRDSFRALVLLPLPRRDILLAKNLAFAPFVAVIGVTLLVLVKFVVRMPWASFGTGLVQLPVVFILFSLICNLVSVLAPYRLATGTLQAKKPKPLVFLAFFGTMLTMPLVISPVLLGPGMALLFAWQHWTPWLPINLLTTILALSGAAAVYRLALPWEGRLLQQREQAILTEVTEELQ